MFDRNKFKVLLKAIASVMVMFCLSASDVKAQTLYDIELNLGNYGNLDQRVIPSIGDYACGPTAVVNSFVYLQKTYPNKYGELLIPPQLEDLDRSGEVDFYDDMIAVAQTLASFDYDYMRTFLAGTTHHDDLIWGKNQYLEERSPGRTAYSAQDWGWLSWNDPGRPIPNYVDPVLPTWNFLYDSLLESAAIELLISKQPFGGHYLTLTSFHWLDENDDAIIQQTEDAWIGFMDPWGGLIDDCNIWHVSNGTLLATDYFPESFSSILMATTAVPVPEPTSLLLLGSGLLGLVGLKKKRKSV